MAVAKPTAPKHPQEKGITQPRGGEWRRYPSPQGIGAPEGGWREVLQQMGDLMSMTADSDLVEGNGGMMNELELEKQGNFVNFLWKKIV